MKADGEGQFRFPTTQWHHVAAAAGENANRHRPGLSQKALSDLLIRYLSPLRTHLVRTRRLPPDRADDVLQSFVTSKVLANGLLETADASRGRFRTYLLTALDRHLIDHVRHESTRNRGRVEAPEEGVESMTPRGDGAPPPDDVYDLAWAREVLDRSVEATRERFLAGGREDLWAVFEQRVLRPIRDNVPPPPYDEFVGQFGFTTATQACSAVVTAKRAFARALRDVVGEYCDTEDAIDAEVIDLRQILATRR